jgi:hypothetical protein
VDSRQVLQRKKEALDAVLPGWRRDMRRPSFAEGVTSCTPLCQPICRQSWLALQQTAASSLSLCLDARECNMPLPSPPAVDFGGSLKQLITELTAAGFNPSARCCVVAEGLLCYLEQVGGQCWALLNDAGLLPRMCCHINRSCRCRRAEPGLKPG